MSTTISASIEKTVKQTKVSETQSLEKSESLSLPVNRYVVFFSLVVSGLVVDSHYQSLGIFLP